MLDRVAVPAGAKRAPFAYISLKTQFENLGDALINRELVKLVSARAHTTVDLTRSPASFHRTMGLSGMPGVRTLSGFRGRLFWEMFAHRLAGRRCYFFLNPGGLGGGVGERFSTFCKSHIYNLMLFALKLAGVRICQVGVSYERMAWMEASVAKLRSKACHAFTVRDQESFDYIRSLGIRTSEVVPDLSFDLYQTPADPAAEITYAAAFSFRADKGVAADTLAAFASAVMETHADDAQFLFASQVGRDSALMRRVHQTLAAQLGKARVHFAEFHDDFDAAFSHYGRCQAMYSNRLHVLLMAAYVHATPIAIVNAAKQRKVAALFEDMVMTDNLHPFSTSAPVVIGSVDRQKFMNASRRLNTYFDGLLDG